MRIFFQLLRKSTSELTRYPGFLLLAWLVVTLSLPLLNLVFGTGTLMQGLALSILLQTAFVLNVLYRAWGWWSMLRTSAGVVLLVWAVQAIIIRSGLPYGELMYSSILQPQLLGIPVLVPLSWLMMLPPAWVVARLITQKLTGCLLRLSFILLSAVCFTGWMLALDPLMAHFGILTWNPIGNFYGTPEKNFIFWLFIAGLVTFAISPKRLPGGALLLLYTLSWLVYFIVLFFIGGLFLPAMISLLVMGGMLAWGGLSLGNKPAIYQG